MRSWHLISAASRCRIPARLIQAPAAEPRLALTSVHVAIYVSKTLMYMGVARGYLHDPSQDRKNELDPSFKRSDPLHYKILIVLVQYPIQALFISFTHADMHVII